MLCKETILFLQIVNDLKIKCFQLNTSYIHDEIFKINNNSGKIDVSHTVGNCYLFENIR